MGTSPIDVRNGKLGPRVAEALEKRHFEACYVDTAAEACEKALSWIPAGASVCWGGAMTAEQIGLIDAVRNGGYEVIDRDAVPREQREDTMRKGLLCDTFIMGSNAISEDGQMVNIDGNGNRMAAMVFGPRQVIVVAGMNKVAKTLDDAIVRARTIAAPLNMQRFPNLKTPCSATGSCADCKSPDSICTYLLVTRLSHPASRIKVILIGEDLGL